MKFSSSDPEILSIRHLGQDSRKMLRYASRIVSKTALQFRLNQVSRNLHISRYALAAKIFDMPAMSPTMESGAIVEWKVKEGDHYNSGDSLLDIETDKATISVDAIDDGVLAKILLPNGTKDVKVGTPIAFLAEDGDDLKTIEYPKLPDQAKPEASETKVAEQTPPKPASTETSAPSPEIPKPTKSSAVASSSSPNSRAANPSQQFFPSVQRLLEENKISREDALKKIPATGPHGRLLRGDILVYLGKVSAEENNSLVNYLEKTSHLDLSHIELLEQSSSDKTAAKEGEKPKPKVKELVIIAEHYPIDIEVSYPEMSKFKSAISEAISSSEQQAYAYNTNPISDLDDPLFDDIIAPPRSADRFKIDYILNIEGNDVTSLDLKLTLNASCFDAKDRAAVFVNSFKENLADHLKSFQ